MKDIALNVDGTTYRAKNLDDSFARFVQENFRDSGVVMPGNNSAERLFIAYLKLAGKYHDYDKEIEEIVKNIENSGN